MSKNVLGRGLSSFIPSDNKSEVHEKAPVDANEPGLGIYGVIQIPLSLVKQNPLQPRQKFDEAKLQELADSIKIHGVIQPVVVTKSPDGYRLVVGERRFRAAKLAGLDTIPALIREFADQQMLEVALIENLQREDLNPIEEAKAFSYLLKEHDLTHEQLSERLGCSRPAISNSLRLLNLSEEIRADLEAGILKPGHARAVLAIENEALRAQAWKVIKDKDMSVRQTEEYVNSLLTVKPQESGEDHKPRLSPDFQNLVMELSRQYGTDIRIKPKKNGKGHIEFHYANNREMERLLELFIYYGSRQNN